MTVCEQVGSCLTKTAIDISNQTDQRGYLYYKIGLIATLCFCGQIMIEGDEHYRPVAFYIAVMSQAMISGPFLMNQFMPFYHLDKFLKEINALVSGALCLPDRSSMNRLLTMKKGIRELTHLSSFQKRINDHYQAMITSISFVALVNGLHGMGMCWGICTVGKSPAASCLLHPACKLWFF